MTIEVLLTINPKLYNQLIKQLKEYTRYCEDKYRCQKYEMGFRFFKPDDPGISMTCNQYDYTYTTVTEKNLLSQSRPMTVPYRDAYVYLGWYCNTSLGKGGYLKFHKHHVTKNCIDADVVYLQQNPEHYFFDVNHITLLMEMDVAGFITYNANDYDVHGKIYPILYRIATKAALNLESMGGKEYEGFEWDESTDNVDLAMPQKIENDRIKNIEKQISTIANMYQPIERVKIKDAPFSSHMEMRTKLDPSVKSYLEAIKNTKVCEFCGAAIYNGATFCGYCGVPFNYKEETKEVVVNAFKKVKK